MSIKWNIANLKTIKSIKISFFVLLTFIALHFVTSTASEPYNPYTLFVIIIGVILLIAVSVFTYNRFKYKKIVTKIVDDFGKSITGCCYEFSNQSIRYYDDIRQTELKWEAISYYSNYKEFLLIWINDDCMVFDTKDEPIYEEIQSLVESKLPYKKVI